MVIREVAVQVGGEVLLGRAWIPIDEVSGILCLIHGLGEHIGRYEHVAQYLTRSGYALMGVDLFGHGRSPGPRGHLGPYWRIMAVVKECLQEAERQAPGAARFLYGHSMGGNIVLNYVARENPEIAGAVVTSPWLRLAVPLPRVAEWALGLVSRVRPAFAQPNRLASSHLSRDPAVGARYDVDPLVHNMISAETFWGVSRAARWVMGHPERIRLPLLLMHGSADAITDPAASAELAEGIGANCTLKQWDGFYHELHNEPEKTRVLEFLRDWIDSRRDR